MGIKEIVDELAERTASDGSVNQIQLIQQTSDIGRIVSLLYGLLSGIILILVPLVTTLELIYLCFPVVREGADKLLVKVETKGIAKRALGFTLRDALEAVERAETVEAGKSPLGIYLWLKVKSVYIIMFIICLVMNGSSTIMNFIWSLIAGVIDFFM